MTTPFIGSRRRLVHLTDAVGSWNVATEPAWRWRLRDLWAWRSVLWSMRAPPTTSLMFSNGGPSGGVGVVPSLEDLYADHAKAMYRVAVSIVRDHALAEDVVHDAVIKAWRNMDSFRGESSWKSWLLRITHNTAISTLRRLRDTVVDPTDLPDPPTRNLEHEAIDQAFVEAFEEALFTLDPMSRAVVTLREVENLSYEQIAEVLEVSEAVVKTRLYRARRSLAGELSDWSTHEPTSR